MTREECSCLRPSSATGVGTGKARADGCRPGRVGTRPNPRPVQTAWLFAVPLGPRMLSDPVSPRVFYPVWSPSHHHVTSGISTNQTTWDVLCVGDVWLATSDDDDQKNTSSLDRHRYRRWRQLFASIIGPALLGPASSKFPRSHNYADARLLDPDPFFRSMLPCRLAPHAL